MCMMERMMRGVMDRMMRGVMERMMGSLGVMERMMGSLVKESNSYQVST